MTKSMLTGLTLVLLFGAASFYLPDLFAEEDRSLTSANEYAMKMLQKKCEVKRTANEWADVKCSMNGFDHVERHCSVFVKAGDLTQATLLCRGKQAGWVGRECKVWMSGITKGELACLEKAKKRVVGYMARYEGGKPQRSSLFGG